MLSLREFFHHVQTSREILVLNNMQASLVSLTYVELFSSFFTSDANTNCSFMIISLVASKGIMPFYFAAPDNVDVIPVRTLKGTTLEFGVVYPTHDKYIFS